MSYYDGGTTLYSDLDDLYQPSPEFSTGSSSGYSAISPKTFYWVTLTSSLIIFIMSAGVIHNWDRCLSWHGGDDGDGKKAAFAFQIVAYIVVVIAAGFLILSIWALVANKSFTAIGSGVARRAKRKLDSYNRDYEINEMQARMGVDPRDEAVSQLV